MCKDERCPFILRCSGSSYRVVGYLDSSVPAIFRSPNPPQNDSNYSSLLLTLWIQRTTANFNLRYSFATLGDKPFWFIGVTFLDNKFVRISLRKHSFPAGNPWSFSLRLLSYRTYWAESLPPQASSYNRWAGQSTRWFTTALKQTRHRTLS
jgi:hypothetical protein